MSGTDLTLQRSVDTLYRDHHGWLYSWLRRKLGNALDAADLAHDTYMRMLASGRLPEPAQSRQYLTQIARGLAIDLYRRRRIEAAYLEIISQLPEARVPGTETRLIVIETLAEIDTILHNLPEQVRRALLLRKLDGWSYRDIAAQLGVSISSVEKYIARALLACYQAVYETPA